MRPFNFQLTSDRFSEYIAWKSDYVNAVRVQGFAVAMSCSSLRNYEFCQSIIICDNFEKWVWYTPADHFWWNRFYGTWSFVAPHRLGICMPPPCQKGVIFGRILPAILPIFEKSSQNILDWKSEYGKRSGQWPNVQKHNNIRCRGWQRPMIWDITVRTVDTRTDIPYVRLNFPPVYPVKF